MGQGADAMSDDGAWDDFVERENMSGNHVMRNGTTIPIDNMSDRHLDNTINYLRRTIGNYPCTHDDEMAQERLDMFLNEQWLRSQRREKSNNQPIKPKQAKSKPRGEMVEVKCKCCKTSFMARVADRKRGWGRFCSKSCKAKVQS